MDFDELYQAVILDHSRKPRNYGEMPDATVSISGDNPMCGDEITLQLKVAGEQVENIMFTGSGCSICMASASLMTMKVKGKTKDQGHELLHHFQEMVTGEEAKEPDPSLGDLALLQGVRKFPQRVKCATLAWHALRQAMDTPAGGKQFSIDADSPDL